MIEIFTWISTFFFLFGAFLYSSKKASNPRRRMKGFISYEIGGWVYIGTCLVLGLYPYALTQIVFCVFDIRGIINCWKEIKRTEIDCKLPSDYYSNKEYNEDECEDCDYKLFATPPALSEEKIKSILKKYEDNNDN